MYIVRRGSAAGDEVLKLVASELRGSDSIEVTGRMESGSYAALAKTEAVERILESIKSTGMRGTIKQSVDKLLQKCPATHAMTRVTGTYSSL
jgi:hypothetical protein